MASRGQRDSAEFITENQGGYVQPSGCPGESYRGDQHRVFQYSKPEYGRERWPRLQRLYSPYRARPRASGEYHAQNSRHAGCNKVTRNRNYSSTKSIRIASRRQRMTNLPGADLNAAYSGPVRARPGMGCVIPQRLKSHSKDGSIMNLQRYARICEMLARRQPDRQSAWSRSISLITSLRSFVPQTPLACMKCTPSGQVTVSYHGLRGRRQQ